MDSGGFTVFILFVVTFFVYFLPWGVANERKHRNASAIGMLNLLLGWTVLGWIVAMIWAMTDNVDPSRPKGRTFRQWIYDEQPDKEG